MYQLIVKRLIDSHKVINIVDTENKLKKEHEHYEKEFIQGAHLKGQYEITLLPYKA